MEKVNNINWELERELINVNDCDEHNHYEEDWEISFEYNGHKLTATIDFTLELIKYDDEDTNTHDVDVHFVDVTIKKMLLENEYDFILPTKEEVRLQWQLAGELKIEF